jgi:CheY-like chemotaxis protein
VNSIMRNAEAQGRLIEDVLDITRIVNQKMSLDREILNFDGIFSEAIEAVRPSAESKAITLHTSIESRDLLVHADRARLQQVMLNLLTNAVKFTPPGGQVSLHVTRDGESARIEVSDTGIGISADLLPHIFERFRQGDSSSTRAYGGLGLGLAIARQLVMLHGGKIDAQSDGDGKGSRFIVSLPLVALDARVPTDGQQPAADQEIFPAESLRGLHVMVVDDNASVRDLVALTLTKCGASVTVASSVRDALGLMPNLAPDVVVSDVAMPGADGYEFVRKFRALTDSKGAKVPVIALTAFGSVQDRERALQAGFDQHLSKPIDPVELVRAIVASRSPRDGTAASEEAAPAGTGRQRR